MNESRLKWGILGPGRIARSFAIGLATSATGQLVAAGSRDLERSRTFLQTHADATHGSEPSAYGSYEELIADPQVEALYIAGVDHSFVGATPAETAAASTRAIDATFAFFQRKLGVPAR